MPAPVTRHPGGRPRRPATDQAILDAAYQLIAEQGLRQVSIERIAVRAGVATTTVYRRYRTLDDVLLALVERFRADLPVTDTGDLRADLIAAFGSVDPWNEPHRVRFWGELAAAQAGDDRLAAAYRRQLAPRRERMTGLIRAAIDRGELRPDTDAELLLDLVSGVFTQRLLVHRAPLAPTLVVDAVDAVLDGARPRP